LGEDLEHERSCGQLGSATAIPDKKIKLPVSPKVNTTRIVGRSQQKIFSNFSKSKEQKHEKLLFLFIKIRLDQSKTILEINKNYHFSSEQSLSKTYYKSNSQWVNVG